MISKTAFLSAFALQASALTPGSATYDSTFTCTQCVTNGFKWCAPEADMYQSVATPTTNKCVETATSCASGEFDFTTLVNKDLMLAACENDSDICGSTTQFIGLTGTTATTVAIAANMPVNTKCSFVVQCSEGFPLYKYTGTATDNTDLEISYMHYTFDSRWTPSLESYVYPVNSNVMQDKTSYTGAAEYPRKEITHGYATSVSWANLTG